jgi:bifunctional non-homologous end joining protein LigD
MTGLLDALPPELDSRTRTAAPGVELAASPMLATLSDRRDFPQGWIFERKLDGMRVLAVGENGSVTLRSRSGRRLDATFPEIVDALAAQDCTDFTIDGEIVAYSHGRTDFARLRQRMGLTRRADVAASKVAVTYYVFDLLRLDGVDVRRLPLRTRKSLLRRSIAFTAPLRFSTHRNEGGPELLADACRRGWEGHIAKRADSTYQTRRSDDWLKLKCAQGQEFVVGGFTEPAGSRVGIGYYEDGWMRYAGKVGTGFDRRTLLALRQESTDSRWGSGDHRVRAGAAETGALPGARRRKRDLGRIRGDRADPRRRVGGGPARGEGLIRFALDQRQVGLRPDQGEDRLVDRHRVRSPGASRTLGQPAHLLRRAPQFDGRRRQADRRQQPHLLPRSRTAPVHGQAMTPQIVRRRPVRRGPRLLALRRRLLRRVPVRQVRRGQTLDLIRRRHLQHAQRAQHITTQRVRGPRRIRHALARHHPTPFAAPAAPAGQPRPPRP